jgi:hypothetical protein
MMSSSKHNDFAAHFIVCRLESLLLRNFWGAEYIDQLHAY